MSRRIRDPGRYLEPRAKNILRRFGIDVPRFLWAGTADDAARFARRIGYPLTVKVVSPAIYCKSDWGGVETEIGNDAQLRAAFHRFSRLPKFMGMLVEEHCSEGTALKVGVVRIDYGSRTAVFLEPCVADRWFAGCRGCLLSGCGQCHIRAGLKKLGVRCCACRGGEPIINEKEFERMLINAVRILAEHAPGIEAMILDPVHCTPDRCIVLDARIKLCLPFSTNNRSTQSTSPLRILRTL